VHRWISIHVFTEFGRWSTERTITYLGVPYNVKLNNKTELQKNIKESKEPIKRNTSEVNTEIEKIEKIFSNKKIRKYT
jgi:hypothetical protein